MKRVRAAAALMERLRAAEATVGEDPYTLLKQPFLSIISHLLSVNGERGGGRERRQECLCGRLPGEDAARLYDDGLARAAARLLRAAG